MAEPPEDINYMGLGIAIGAGPGFVYGVALGLAADNPVFFGIGISIGVGIGVAIGTALNARNKGNDA